MSPETTVLLGKGTLAIKIADWFLASPDHALSVIVPVMPEPRWTDSLTEWAQAHRVPYVESGDYREVFERMASTKVDLAISVFYDKIIRLPFIEECGRILNLHNSPLPKYRGVSPINWALKNGEIEHGLTIHEITPGIDDGPIIARVLYSIYPDVDEVADVYERSLEYGWTLFQETVPNLARIQPRPQDDAQSTYYSTEDNDRLGDRRYFTRAESQPRQ